MNKIFFGGSRRLTRLNHAVQERAENIIAQGYTVLIGDANGADKSMQRYLAEKNYQNVIVFCMGSVCRNNIGHWQTRYITTDKDKKGFGYYSIKDQKMSEEATYGFMMWDAKSKGTLNNIINLLERQKKVLVYLSSEKEFYNLKNAEDLRILLEHCDKETLGRFEKLFQITRRLNSKQPQLDLTQS